MWVLLCMLLWQMMWVVAVRVLVVQVLGVVLLVVVELLVMRVRAILGTKVAQLLPLVLCGPVCSILLVVAILLPLLWGQVSLMMCLSAELVVVVILVQVAV
jgi:hypothetical protein